MNHDSPPPGPATVLSLFDAQALDKLRVLDPQGTHGLVARVLRTFAESLERHADELRDARHAMDFAALRLVAHTLKSSAATVGALELARLSTDIEALSRQQSPDSFGAVLDAMQTELQRLREAMAALPWPPSA